MKKFLFVLISLFASNASAQVARCPLDVSNPAITHKPIPIHGGSLQGVTSYSGPSEWKYFSYQKHWTSGNDMTSGSPTFDNIGVLLLKSDNAHLHIEWCYPYAGEITDSITIPFRIQIFHAAGKVTYLAGEMVSDIVFDAGSPPLVGDPMGDVIATGHLTLNPHIGTPGGSTNIHHAAINGWTNFSLCSQFNFTNGSAMANCAFASIYTILDPKFPPQVEFLTQVGVSGTGFSANQGGTQWGEHTSATNESMPLLAPLTAPWSTPTMAGYSYAASGDAGLLSGISEMRKDMDLHNGVIGSYVGPLGLFDPVQIGQGIHNIAMIWQTRSNNGFPGVTNPGEFLTSLLVTSVEVAPANPLLCQDHNALNPGQPLPCKYPPPPPGTPTVDLTLIKGNGSYHLEATASDPNGIVGSTIYVDTAFYTSNSTGKWSIDIPADTSKTHTFWVTAINPAGIYGIVAETK